MSGKPKLVPGQAKPVERARTIDPLAMLSDRAARYTPPTDEEIRAAAQYHETAGRLLVSAILDRANSPDATPKEEGESSSGLLAYLAHKRATEDLKSLNTDTTTAASRKDRLRQALTTRIEATEEAAQRFGTVLVAVGALANRADQELTRDNGRPDMTKIIELHERTDSLEHPILTVLPVASEFESNSTQRAAITHADRLLRFMVDQTLVTPEHQTA